MQMSKEEFVKTIQKMAKRERERKEMKEKEKKRKLSFIVTDYIMSTSRKMKWDRNYRRSRCSPRKRKWESSND